MKEFLPPKSVILKISRFFLVTILVFSWIFFGWPQMLSRAQEATSTVETLSPVTEQPASEEPAEEPPAEEEELQVPEPPQPELPPQPPLKKHKLERRISIDKNARHGCQAVNFTVDMSNKNSASVELGLHGQRGSLENIEIGSLPDGIDITFLNNADYFLSPSKSDNAVVVEIANQPGSQKGNFSVSIIYTQKGGKDSSVICQINIVNL